MPFLGRKEEREEREEREVDFRKVKSIQGKFSR